MPMLSTPSPRCNPDATSIRSAGGALLSRRAFGGGIAGALAAALLPRLPRAQGFVHVRRSIADLVDATPLESYRRAVAVMMARDVDDKTGWWFQANMVGVSESALAGAASPALRYWRQNPRRNYFFLAWQRMHLYFFERIVRRACGDPIFALPCWAVDNAERLALPTPFRSDPDQIETPAMSRRNALARAQRNAAFERGERPIGDFAGDFAAALGLSPFAAADALDTRGGFGGVRVTNPMRAASAGAMEALHERVLMSIGRDGDLASPTTAARDPVYWLLAANIDRLWAQWTARGGVPPVDDERWMRTPFTFVDENGEDRVLTGADVLDTQFQLGYRYDDDPPRPQRLTFVPRTPATPLQEPLVLARAVEIDLSAQETAVVFAPVPPRRSPQQPKGAKGGGARAARTLVVLREAVVPERAPAYDLSLVLEGPNVFEPTTTSLPIGSLERYGGSGRGDGSADSETIAFDATEALAKLGKLRGFNLRHLRLTIVRRALRDASGVQIVPEDPQPPEIGAIELVRM
ncbi:MAG: tyrosinase family protein [Hyphomicrobiales bacterium]|nr:tyrosinase family protein [Hyphomicrobiales bacterium]